MEYTETISINGHSREEYREQLISLFLKENHGSSSEVTYYYYYVDTLRDGNQIYLKRPTQLNKGVDFEVRVSGINFRYGKHGNTISTGNRPSHNDIFDDLLLKKDEDIHKFETLIMLITRIYHCEDVTLSEYESCQFQKGLPTDLILKVLKWLFIEQDITYWNRSGREMLFNNIIELWEK
ncbi:hypothetical protein [Parabacteroides sp. AM08-6]|uniref:hypothetical protein n=1 Tax=Parabacteroides sp. AM08-6 TaxID=2292053 RepID=UPI000EFE1394|nr:hypothetical protein [Parabacteroides sp. AM08-6]RHJ78126.1 hypothetical protein DW103_15490 [Parabacteroides sp. AM08-6]